MLEMGTIKLRVNVLKKHWKIGQYQAVQHAVELGIHDNMSDACWETPWEHDPPQRDAINYMRTHPGSDDDEYHEDSSSEASSDDQDSGDNDGDCAVSSVGVNTVNEHDQVQFDHAVCMLAQRREKKSPASLHESIVLV